MTKYIWNISSIILGQNIDVSPIVPAKLLRLDIRQQNSIEIGFAVVSFVSYEIDVHISLRMHCVWECILCTKEANIGCSMPRLCIKISRMHASFENSFIYLLNPVNERKSDYGMMKIEENYSHFQQNAVHWLSRNRNEKKRTKNKSLAKPVLRKPYCRNNAPTHINKHKHTCIVWTMQLIAMVDMRNCMLFAWMVAIVETTITLWIIVRECCWMELRTDRSVVCSLKHPHLSWLLFIFTINKVIHVQLYIVYCKVCK